MLDKFWDFRFVDYAVALSAASAVISALSVLISLYAYRQARNTVLTKDGQIRSGPDREETTGENRNSDEVDR